MAAGESHLSGSSTAERSGGMPILLPVAGLLLIADLYLIFIWVPTEQVMGIVQRLFYIHVPTVWVGFLAFFIVFIASIMYLIKRSEAWDRRAFAAAEVGVVFLTIAIAEGSIWGKPVWGTWWIWDAKLTTTFILWVIYIGYLMVRSYAPNPERAGRWAAVVGIVGFVDVPVVYYASVLWRTLHPALVTGPSASGSLEDSMLLVLLFSLATFTVLFVYLFRERLQERQLQDEIGAIRKERLTAAPPA